MRNTHVVAVGVDPGLKDTGIVSLRFTTSNKIEGPYSYDRGKRPVYDLERGKDCVLTAATAKQIAEKIFQAISWHFNRMGPEDIGVYVIYIEKFKSRGKAYGSTEPMMKLEADLMTEIQATIPKRNSGLISVGSKRIWAQNGFDSAALLIPNTGVKTLVTDRMLNTFDLLRYSIPSNHQDLKSAGRILLMGMLKDRELNREVLYHHAVRTEISGHHY